MNNVIVLSIEKRIELYDKKSKTLDDKIEILLNEMIESHCDSILSVELTEREYICELALLRRLINKKFKRIKEGAW